MQLLGRLLNCIFKYISKLINKSINFDNSYEKTLKAGKNRSLIIKGVVWTVYSIISLKIVLIGGFPNDIYTKKPSYAPKKTITRESIYDRNGTLVADFLNSDGLYVNPKMVKDAKLLQHQLLEIFPNMNPDKLYKKLTRKARFVWLVRRLTPKQKYSVNALGDISLNFIKAKTRIYPHENLMSHILGYVNVDNIGVSGIEKKFDKKLSELEKPVHLTIDARIQYILRSEILKMMKLTSAIGGTGIVMDVTNGEVIAMTSLPDFDPNHPNKGRKNFLNKATHAVYELGSTFKIINSAIALESKKVSIRDVYDATKPIKIGKFVINDYHAQKKILSVPEIFIHSSNIGSIKMIMDVGTKIQKEKMQELNLLEPLDIILPERAKTIYPKYWRKTETATISYGHGISVSPLHLVSAIGAVVNGGTYYKPLFIKDQIAEGRTVFSSKTSRQVRKLMRYNTTNGSGKLTNVQGYLVGSKTGTAEKPKNGGYDKKALISSLVASFPMHNPKYIVYILIDEPQPSPITNNLRPTGGWVGAPVAAKVIEQIAPILDIYPVDENNPAIKRAMKIPPPKNTKTKINGQI
ncbi:MAG: penicillin-binding protein 2 [Alphaproteobacteria bacterium]|nr:penicillin-binding protein 2 [Alphaproteobacteria bacterium]